MDAKVIQFYRSIFSDLSVDREEAAELTEFLQGLNPPPDKLLWLRATAFRIGCEFLSDDNDSNISLLRTINFIVHAIEKTCMEPKRLANTVDLDEEAVTNFYKELFDDLSVDREESAELFAFFRETHPPAVSDLIQTRALAFKVACDHLAEDKEINISLLRCVNVIVHAFEQTCLQPKSYELHLTESADLSMSLSEAVQYLWNLDDNRLTPNEDYVINVQEGKKPYWKEDKAEEPLFTSVDRNVWKRPTYSAFIKLLDNYSAETGIEEVVSNAEREEVNDFLDAIMQTPPMQFCHKYCHEKDPDRVPSDKRGFKQLLHKIWFEIYRRERGGRLDSSGFEHVFVGEAKNGDVSGFHNWIQFFLEEQRQKVDYRGYLKPRSHGEAEANSNDHLLTLQFNWGDVEKFAGTFFVGVSPEFEMALYTMCFLVGEEANEVELDTGTDKFGLVIKCYRMSQDKIGTSYPEVSSHYED